MEEYCVPFASINSNMFNNPDTSNIRNLLLNEHKPKLLMHACCGPCATSCVERMIKDYSVTVFYYNPNITDAEEYFRRRDSLVKFIDAFNASNEEGAFVNYIEGVYDPEKFIKRAESLKSEPEGGKRCSICFEMRLAETAKMAESLQMDYFTTVMTVSPHKNYDEITAIGKSFAESITSKYLAEDFKKKNGFGRSVEMSKEYGLYRQRFCGCEYSRGDR